MKSILTLALFLATISQFDVSAAYEGSDAAHGSSVKIVEIDRSKLPQPKHSSLRSVGIFQQNYQGDRGYTFLSPAVGLLSQPNQDNLDFGIVPLFRTDTHCEDWHSGKTGCTEESFLLSFDIQSMQVAREESLSKREKDNRGHPQRNAMTPEGGLIAVSGSGSSSRWTFTSSINSSRDTVDLPGCGNSVYDLKIVALKDNRVAVFCERSKAPKKETESAITGIRMTIHDFKTHKSWSTKWIDRSELTFGESPKEDVFTGYKRHLLELPNGNLVLEYGKMLEIYSADGKSIASTDLSLVKVPYEGRLEVLGHTSFVRKCFSAPDDLNANRFSCEVRVTVGPDDQYFHLGYLYFDFQFDASQLRTYPHDFALSGDVNNADLMVSGFEGQDSHDRGQFSEGLYWGSYGTRYNYGKSALVFSMLAPSGEVVDYARLDGMGSPIGVTSDGGLVTLSDDFVRVFNVDGSLRADFKPSDMKSFMYGKVSGMRIILNYNYHRGVEVLELTE